MKYKHEKEHPVDNLFARKLGNLEGTPSENAWQTLEKGLSQKAGKKNKGFLWLPYAAAASLVLLIVSVWLLQYKGSGSLTSSGLATREKGEQKQNQPKQKSSATDNPASAISSGIPSANSKDTNSQIAMQEKTGTKADVKAVTKTEAETKAEQANIRTAGKKPAVPATADKPMPEQLTNPVITPLENTVAQIEKQPSVMSPSSFAKNEGTTLVVTVNLDEEETAVVPEEELAAREEGEVQKKSKAGKFFSTLKKIKKGDFDELGIRPETIVAYVKDRASANNQSENK